MSCLNSNIIILKSRYSYNLKQFFSQWCKDKEYFRSYCPNIYTAGTGLGSKAVVEVTKEKSVRVDGVIIDSPIHSFEYALEKGSNFYYYSSFLIDWSNFLEIAGLKVHTANVSINVTNNHSWGQKYSRLR